MKCKFNDCGWCYCESGKSNDNNGACNRPEDCDEYKIQIESAKITEQVFISCLPVSATIETDEQGATCIKMPTSEVDVRLWARVCASAGFRVIYQYVSGRYRLDCICVDLGGNYRGIYSKSFCTVWLGKAELFA